MGLHRRREKAIAKAGLVPEGEKLTRENLRTVTLPENIELEDVLEAAHVRTMLQARDYDDFPGLNASQRAFLSSYALLGNISLACTYSHTARSTHYEWMRRYEDYRQAFRRAQETFADLVETEVMRRAIHGWYEPVVSAGKLVTYVKKYDSKLLETYLRGKKPAEFRENIKVDARLEQVVKRIALTDEEAAL